MRLFLLACTLLFSSCLYLSQVGADSMSNTFSPGQKTISRGFVNIQKGDVYTFIYKQFERKDEQWFFRLMAQSGDVIQIKEGKVYVNEVLQQDPDRVKFSYYIFTLEKQSVLSEIVDTRYVRYFPKNAYLAHLDKYECARLTQHPGIRIEKTNSDYMDVSRLAGPAGKATWGMDNYGPLRIPEVGDTITITHYNKRLYEQVLLLEEASSNQLVIKQELYFFLGDNRHNAWDSRIMGFVPREAIFAKVRERKTKD